MFWVKKLLAVLAVGISFSLAPGMSAVEAEPKAIEGYQQMLTITSETVTEKTENGKIAVKMVYPILVVQGDYDTAVYNAVASSIRAENVKMAELMKEWYDYILPQAKEYAARSGGYYSYTLTADLIRADELMASYLLTHDIFTGGARPQVFFESKNFDAATGEPIVLESICKDMDKLCDVLKKKLLAEGKKRGIKLEEGQIENYLTANVYGDGRFDWTKTLGVVTFYFSPGEITSPAAGPFIVELPMAEWSGLIKY